MRLLEHMLGQGLSRLANHPAEFAGTASRTLAIAIASTAAAAAIGIPIGALLGLRRGRMTAAFASVANAGLGLPAVVLGVYLALFMLPGSPLGFLHLTNTLSGVLLAQWLLATPIVIALTAAAVAAGPAALLAQAAAFGATRRAVLSLAARECMRPIATALFAAFGSALAEVGAVVIVGGNIRGSTNTLASTVLLDLSAGDPAGATANVILLLVLIGLLGGLFARVQRAQAG